MQNLSVEKQVEKSWFRCKRRNFQSYEIALLLLLTAIVIFFASVWKVFLTLLAVFCLERKLVLGGISWQQSLPFKCSKPGPCFTILTCCMESIVRSYIENLLDKSGLKDIFSSEVCFIADLNVGSLSEGRKKSCCRTVLECEPKQWYKTTEVPSLQLFSIVNTIPFVSEIIRCK